MLQTPAIVYLILLENVSFRNEGSILSKSLSNQSSENQMRFDQ